MIELLVAVLACGQFASASAAEAPAAVSAGAAAAAPNVAPGRVDLATAIPEALRRWTRPAADQRAEAGRELLALYRQLQSDVTLPTPQRESLRLRLRYRLLEISSQLQAAQTREKNAAPAAPAAEPRPATVDVPAMRAAVLAQRANAFAAPGSFAAGLAGPVDNGDQLVELIQRTVAPASWDVNGGPGVAYYWRPGQALVIRQRSEAHEQLGGLLNQLQQAGR